MATLAVQGLSACHWAAGYVIHHFRSSRTTDGRASIVTERQAFIALNRVTGLGAVTVKRLIEALGSATAILRADERVLRSVRGMGPERAAQIGRELAQADWRDEERRAGELGVQLLTWADDGYPKQLREIFDPPLALYVSGDQAALNGTAVAVVGTRHPTHYGRECAHLFGFQLGGAGIVVVSGLARGIDTEAHRGALQAKGRTVAVLGGALDCLYPEENRDLAREIATQGGAVISEYPFGRQPDRQTFPMRNRIVSGLSAGVLVVEASLTSGTLITVDQALEQGRTVMAMPGRIDSVASQGCHKLLRSGARLVTSVEEVIEELQELTLAPRVQPAAAPAPADCSAPPGPLAGLGEEEERLLGVLGDDEQAIDDLVRLSRLDAGRVNGLLVGLQIKRRVRLLPGGMVRKNVVGALTK
ncbi:MAG: DNA-processing protein DprA [Kiritimatiellae bacterium]|nr:DNA-processing protein DprA [Kiritimatiellia bacterium]